MKKNLNPAYSLKLKNIILLLNRDFFFFKWYYSQCCFDVENDSVVSTLSNVVQFNVEKQRCFKVVQCCKFQLCCTQRYFNVDLTLCYVAMSYQSKNNVDPTLKCLLGNNCTLRDKLNSIILISRSCRIWFYLLVLVLCRSSYPKFMHKYCVLKNFS